MENAEEPGFLGLVVAVSVMVMIMVMVAGGERLSFFFLMISRTGHGDCVGRMVELWI